MSRSFKVRIHPSKRWVAIYWSKLPAWDFFKILRNGSVSDHAPTVISFENIFSDAVTKARGYYDVDIPASGWNKARVDADEFQCERAPEFAAQIFKRLT